MTTNQTTRTSADVIGEVDDPILRIRDASVTFDMERGTSKVLDGVDIDVGRCEILGVVGESGSGKSMFASSILDAIVEPGVLTGEITYRPDDGDPVDVLDFNQRELFRYRWEEVSMVFQGAMSSFNPTMKFRGHFRETLEYHGYDIKEGMERARDLLEDVYLQPDRILESYPHELSGGMKQRTLIALSLLLDPNVVVMDEPTAALDLLMQRSILSLIHDLKEKYDLTVVFITHDLPLIAGLADRLAVMYAFQFVEFGPTKRVKHNPSHPYTQALLKAVPNIDSPIEEMRPIVGESPDPVDVPTGCAYHPRCSYAEDDCRREDPDIESTDVEAHAVACHHWRNAVAGESLDSEVTDDE